MLHHSTTYVHAAYCCQPSGVVCQSVTPVRPAKMAEAIELLFGLRTWVGPKGPCITWSQDPSMGRGNGRTIVKYRDTLRSSVQKWLNRSRCHLACGLQWNHVSDGIQIPHGKGQFWWIVLPIVKYRDFLPWPAQKPLNWSICCSGCGLNWAKGCISSIVLARWRQCALMSHERTHCHHLANTIAPSVYSGDVPSSALEQNHSHFVLKKEHRHIHSGLHLQLSRSTAIIQTFTSACDSS